MPSAPIPLEDFCEDILGKAQRGLALSDDALAAQAGVSHADLITAHAGHGADATLAKLAPVLGLHAPSLIASAHKSWHPDLPTLPTLAQFNTRWSSHGGILVNNYAVWDPASKKTAIFDTGGDASPLLALIKQLSLRVELILLTHTHGDHVNRLSVLQATLGRPRTCVCTREPLPNTDLIDAGATFALGPLKISTRATHGHSVGGLTYVIHGLAQPVAVVGDALFAGSMGGTRAPGAWPIALQNNRDQILSLPHDTILCPGHGPLTTVAQEKAHNPFFPEFK
jgi:glyoxylase-like metal-dependent hydrolase (beta-lactamase superfamily II)